MSGGFEYNLTTESQFQQMKQKNQQLIEQNMNLKKTLEDLIKINNQFSDTIEQFNNTALSNPQLLRSIQQDHNGRRQSNTKRTANNDHQQCNKMIHNLQEQIGYLKEITSQKIDDENNIQIANTLQGMSDSFQQMQKYYQDEINAICEELDNVKNEWESKIFKIEEVYFEKTRLLEELIKQIRKKQEIISIVEKKMTEQQSKNPKKILKKNSENETSSERKVNSYNPKKDEKEDKNKPNIRQSEPIKEVQQLKLRQKILNEQLKQKDRTIAIYNELLAKLRKKLTQKY